MMWSVRVLLLTATEKGVFWIHEQTIYMYASRPNATSVRGNDMRITFLILRTFSKNVK